MLPIRAPWPTALALAVVCVVLGGAGTCPAHAHGLAAVSATQAEPLDEPPAPPEEATNGDRPANPQAGGRALLLPDLSFIATLGGKLATDRRDPARNRLEIHEAELAIQSYVYPAIRADAFVVMAAEEGLTASLEEGYLTHERLAPRMSGRIGRFFAPFGRSNQLHTHSWPTVRRPLVWRNLVAPEALGGDGAALSWLAPTRGSLFLQVDAGAFSGAGGEPLERDPSPADTDAILGGTGAGFRDRFCTARVWSGLKAAGGSELEAGASWAAGPAVVPADPQGLSRRGLTLTGLDLSYRRYGSGARRLLARAEHVWHRQRFGPFRQTTVGYYALASYRWGRTGDAGLLYDWSGIATLPHTRESAVSAFYTRTLSEQTYLRFQITHGSRPGKRRYHEAWLQIVWGMGPHTHQLE